MSDSVWTEARVEKELAALVEEFRAGNVCPFIGAGFSKNAGYPLWAELMAPLAEELGTPTDANPVEIAQYYVNAHSQGRNLLTKHVLRKIRGVDPEFYLGYQLLKELPVRTMFTTNFDQAIEAALGTEPRRPHHIVIEDTDLPYGGQGDDVTVVKLNGCISRPTSLVMTTEDFENYIEERPAMANLLKTSFSNSTFLFIGSSLRDPTFAVFNSEVLRRLGEHRKAFYTVIANPDAHEVSEYNRRGIEVIKLDTTREHVGNEVAKLLEAINKAVKKTTQDNAVSQESRKAMGVTINDSEDANDYVNLLASRLGTGLSLQTGHADHNHHYTAIERTDLLDYTSGDFVSIRRLKGVNVTDRLSSSLIYSEASESKCTFESTGVVAYDCETREPLVVEPLAQRDEPLFAHAFRVFFDQPISPGEDFDVVYRIRLPGELRVLSPTNEIMSISLVRAVHGVDHLRFNIALNFKPRTYTIECLDANGSRISCKGSRPSLEKYEPTEWYEKELDIEWDTEPYIIRWECEEPDSSLYIINYRA